MPYTKTKNPLRRPFWKGGKQADTAKVHQTSRVLLLREKTERDHKSTWYLLAQKRASP
jgi:hypothetical protein